MAAAKPEVFANLLEAGRARVRLDSRRAGVVLPPRFRNDPQLILDYGRNLSVPIPDLEVDRWGIRATLSFSGERRITFIPWEAVWAIENDAGDGRIWIDDMPDEVEFRRPIEANVAGGMRN